MKRRTYQVGLSTLTLEFGDITTSQAEVLVSSDDSYISMGGGVSAAILDAGGQSILIDAAKKVPAKLGDVVVTSAGSLRAKHLFHVITIGDERVPPKEIVARATRRCLELVDVLGLNSIAFPALGAGVAGFAYDDVASNMAAAVVEYLENYPRSVDATIYLYDRFGEMQPIDYLTFFEEFAVRTKGLNPVIRPRKRAANENAHKSSPGTSKQEKRKKLLTQLAELDHERETLQARLAEYNGALSKSQIKQVDRRLKEVHKKQVEVLSELKPTPAQQSVSVFVSYAHADEKLRMKLGKHLSVLERQGLISTWYDRMITAGTEWEGSIDNRLERSQIILLLVSSDFVNSTYCYDVEMKRALERHQRGDALVIPVILRPVSISGTPFAKLQALPKNARAVTDWPNLDSAFVDITEGVRTALQNLNTRLPNKAPQTTARKMRRS